MNRVYKTAKGTELPLLDLRGKEYLEVKYRLVWFREEHPDWSIETEFLSQTRDSACAKAVIRDGGGKIVATSHKFENQSGFPDFMEKAETGAIGRALALIGYGTQFCADDLDEGSRIVDSPVAPGLTRKQPSEPETDLGEYQIGFGKKYLGRKLKDLPKQDVLAYLAWLEADARKKNTSPSYDVKKLKYAVERFYGIGAPEAPAEDGKQAS